MLEALKGLLTPKQGPRVRFRAMTASYDLIDSEAERVDTQLIVHSDGAAIRDRQPVTLYRLEDHDSMPVWHHPIIVETGLFRRPETRSRWVLEESHHIWQGYAAGTLQVAKAKLSFDPKSLRAMSMILGGVVFVICIIAAVVIASVGGPEQPATTPAGTQTQTVIQGEDHGWVEAAQDDKGAVAGEEGADGGAAAARSPKSAWHPEAGRMARMVAPHLPADRVPMVIESFVIARTSRCLQPPGDPKAVTRLAQLWEQMSGTKTQGVNPLKYILGGGAGLLGGLIMGYALQPAYEAMPPTMVLTVIGAVLGAVVAHYLRGTKTFEDCMLKLVINERRSVVRKEMVTDECEFWVPKALMWHRQREWRRDRKGTTYMWLHLPFRQRITEQVRNMVDGLGLQMDLYTALDSAIKGQRVWNRMLARNAEDFAHLDDGEEPRKPLEEIMPHLIGAGLIIGGLIILMVVAQ